MSTPNGRGWMYERIDGRLISRSWITKLDTKFLNTVFSNEVVVKRNTVDGTIIPQIRCPCLKCKCKKYKSRDDVYLDLMKFGFQPDYTSWWAHGETYTDFQETGPRSSALEDDNGDDVDGCTRMVLDTMRPTDFNNWEEQDPNSDAKKFYDMLEAADEPLYPGCQTFSTLQWASRMMHWKSECNVSESTYNRLVRELRVVLPAGNNVDENFYETKKRLSKLSLPKVKIDACKNHCMLFHDKTDYLTKCGVCGLSRYKDNKGKSKVPNLVLTYFLITPRLQRMYMSKKTAKDMTWHYDHPSEPGNMAHPRDGAAWKHVDSSYPEFAEESRNVRLGLCTDGFTPNSQTSNPYSLWPVFITIYNLPPWMCMKNDYVNLSLVIPGRKSPGQNLDVFLQPLIDELKTLFTHGVETYDNYRKNNFTMKAILLWTVSDFPAYAMLSGWSTHGKLACPSCMGSVDSFQLKNGAKPCWFECHRRFLPKNHEFRHDTNGFKAGNTTSSCPPPKLSGDEIWEQIRLIPTVYEGVPYNAKNRKIPGFGQSHNWVKRSIFWELPYWRILLIRHNLDVMHIEKNVFENLFHTVMDTSKSKDNLKARKDIELYCDRSGLHVSSINNRVLKPKASYTLTKANIKKVCEWLKNVKFPDGYASNIGGCVNLTDCTFYSFKSHDCHVLMQRLLPIALRGMIPNQIWDAITELCTFFRAICSKVLHIKDLQNLKKSIVITICKLEKIFPPGFFDSMEHLVIHLVDEAILGGPVQYRWMYLYERKLGSLKRTVRNKARVEGSIVESYLVKELSTYCSLYFEPTIETRLNREPRNFAPDISSFSFTDNRLSIFKVASRRLFNSGGKKRALNGDEKHKAHTYILLNCPEVYPFIRLFDDAMIQQNPYIDSGTLDKARDEQFAKWFLNNLLSERNDNNENLINLARGPLSYVQSHKGYFVNGYKFHTMRHGSGLVTHNSGVCVKGSTYNESECDYYGSLVEVIEVEYHGGSIDRCIVVLFKCEWFHPAEGIRVIKKHNLVDIKFKKKGCSDDPFILASQAQQVYYAPYPSMTKDLKEWWAVVKTKPRSIFEVSEVVEEVCDVDNNVDEEVFFQESERLICELNTSTNEQICLVTKGVVEEIEPDGINDGMDITIEDGNTEGVDNTMESSVREQEHENMYDDSYEDHVLSYHLSE